MRIAQIAPIVERVPPKKYGGTERVVSALTEELVKMGHKVTLFASGDSETKAHLVSVYPRSLREAGIKDTYGPNLFTMLNIGLAYELQKKFDVIHDHNGHLSFATANVSAVPSVFTMHGSFNPTSREFYSRLGKKANLVAISNAQRKSGRGIKWAGTVYNGLPMEHFPYSARPDKYLLFVGRISLEKGVHHAIEVAQALDLPLIIAAKLDSVDLPYFQEYIGPRLSSEIRWIGEVDEEERNRLMSKALCFLHPVTWPEPFGLALIEAMACGCPVVAFARGSIPELIVNKKTGYVVFDEEGMIKAVKKIDKIDRKSCREYSLSKFGSRRMATDYLEIYKKAIEKNASFSP